MSSSPSTKKITLKTSDEVIFELEEQYALVSQTIKHMIEDGCADSTIPLPNVNSRTMAKVIEYIKKHHELAAEGKDKNYAGEESEELKSWDANFVKEIRPDQDILFDVILASNFLDIQDLLDLLCKEVASMMSGKTVEEIRKIFHIKNDYTPEEEEEVRRENQWAFN
ncbi:hypothetical protein JCGZ_06278 [Jatropha curcas]|uniref:SKP1-like protein n=1 Tax=Jatropha curcas TaxID=180498 RepID=A0A067KMB4_JATCU|nr:SKP1-like protein 1A [Jatropha curcas]KDP37222.1 hypothetical protein JCGZ_06278 [Jatropha curcas]